MTTDERTTTDLRPASLRTGAPGPEGASPGDALLSEGRQLIRASRALVTRALSENAEEFLAANLQHGAQ